MKRRRFKFSPILIWRSICFFLLLFHFCQKWITTCRDLIFEISWKLLVVPQPRIFRNRGGDSIPSSSVPILQISAFIFHREFQLFSCDKVNQRLTSNETLHLHDMGSLKRAFVFQRQNPPTESNFTSGAT